MVNGTSSARKKAKETMKKVRKSIKIDYFDKKVNRELLEEELAELTEREIHIGLRLVDSNDASVERLRGLDLSKVKFDNINFK